MRGRGGKEKVKDSKPTPGHEEGKRRERGGERGMKRGGKTGGERGGKIGRKRGGKTGGGGKRWGMRREKMRE